MECQSGQNMLVSRTLFGQQRGVRGILAHMKVAKEQVTLLLGYAVSNGVDWAISSIQVKLTL
jgi:hypothetical protein